MPLSFSASFRLCQPLRIGQVFLSFLAANDDAATRGVFAGDASPSTVETADPSGAPARSFMAPLATAATLMLAAVFVA